MRLVIDFGTSKTYCGLYDVTRFAGNTRSDRCPYVGQAPSGTPSEAVLELPRGNVQLVVGSDTVIDASISFSGALAGRYLGTYPTAQWQPRGQDFGSLPIDAHETELAPGEDVRGKVVAVTLPPHDPGLAGKNQSGIHLSAVSEYGFAGEQTHVKLEDGLRFPIRQPTFSVVSAAKVRKTAFTLSADRKQITLDSAQPPEGLANLKPNSVVRFENISGQDSVPGLPSTDPTAYFGETRGT